VHKPGAVEQPEAANIPEAYIRAELRYKPEAVNTPEEYTQAALRYKPEAEC